MRRRINLLLTKWDSETVGHTTILKAFSLRMCSATSKSRYCGFESHRRLLFLFFYLYSL